MQTLKRLLRMLFRRVEAAGDYAFGPAWNPFSNLGTLGWFFYWIVAASGIYLYVFFDTGITEAYRSLERITHEHFMVGSVMRSFHRYASDGLVVVTFLHLAREFSLDRLRGRRWFSWFTGVPLLWFIYICGITGYWMVWDTLAQYVAIATTEWLDTLPFFGEPIAANFLSDSALSGRFFTLMVYIHIAVPLFMLMLMWVHIQRLTDAKTNPPKGLAVGTLAALLVLSVVFPAVSQGPANLATVPQTLGIDWFYLTGYPLLDSVPGGVMWLVAVGTTVLLALLPWVPPQRLVTAEVHLDNCNGCSRCEADCPYTAIVMAPRTDGAPYELQAVVSADKCVSCGICAGACPTAMPFRRAGALIPGIELPDVSIAGLRERTLAAAARLDGDGRVIVYGCDHAVGLSALATDNAAVVTLPCVGALPPAFIDFVISRRHAEGVFVAGCSPSACYFRLGDEWTRRRVAGQRDPYLRARVPRERIHLSFVASTARRGEEMAEFRAAVAALGPLPARPARSPRSAETGTDEERSRA
ncbi:MAG: cytochrome b N-terminal domain-containing protein [Gammaproteobacteria bacterium]|nr:MAG: cytochrome b N-terminal domain-containing protein [Gammaproteobacteria bacterium]